MFKWLADLIKSEPVFFQAVIQAGIALGISFGLSMTTEQVGAIMAFTAALLAFLTRTAVTPNTKLPGPS